MSARELPKIDFAGTAFYLDIRLNEFRQVDNFMNRINLDDLWETDKGYAAMFDTKTKNLFAGDGEEYHMRKGKDLAEVQLPTLKEMDPMGFERMVTEWKDNNPMMAQMIENLPIVRENEIKPIGELLKKTKPLLEKNRVRNNKGKRL